MNRSVCQVICDENVHQIFNANISTSNKLSKSIMLTNESIIIDNKIAQGGIGMVFKAHPINSVNTSYNNQKIITAGSNSKYLLSKIRDENNHQAINSVDHSGDSASDLSQMTEPRSFIVWITVRAGVVATLRKYERHQNMVSFIDRRANLPLSHSSTRRLGSFHEIHGTHSGHVKHGFQQRQTLEFRL